MMELEKVAMQGEGLCYLSFGPGHIMAMERLNYSMIVLSFFIEILDTQLAQACATNGSAHVCRLTGTRSFLFALIALIAINLL